MAISVALIGGDGSGKSTLAERLLVGLDMPAERIYMGANLESANYTLPWSRLALTLRLRKLKKEADERGITDPTFVTTHHMSHRNRSSSPARTALRLANRLTEAAYRNGIAELFKRRGRHVIFDRHFLFDVYVEDGPFSSLGSVERINRLYYWILVTLFPKPDLILFLKADPEVMVARKPEATIEYLREWNDYWSRRGRSFSQFVELDANMSADEVFAAARLAVAAHNGTIGRGAKLAAGGAPPQCQQPTEQPEQQ